MNAHKSILLFSNMKIAFLALFNFMRKKWFWQRAGLKQGKTEP